jgi:hypothetical protein
VRFQQIGDNETSVLAISGSLTTTQPAFRLAKSSKKKQALLRLKNVRVFSQYSNKDRVYF